MPKASSLEAKIAVELGEEVQLIAGRGGIFDVRHSGKLIYSKKESNNQFPDENMVINQLREVLKA